jgi:hypothetical protein
MRWPVDVENTPNGYCAAVPVLLLAL